MIPTDELIKRVRHLLNEAEEDVGLSLLSEDTRSINAHISRLLPQAVALVQKNKAPGSGNVNPRKAKVDETTVIDCDNGMAILTMPSDFAGLISVQLAGWKRPCTELYSNDSAEAIAQYNSYTRAGVSRPVCVDTTNEHGSRAILLSPLPKCTDARILHFVYEAEFNADDGLNGCDAVLADAVTYYCAALLYSVFERQDQANAFLSLATLLCNGKNVERRQ